ncbi:MAG: hypothetical protein AAF208_12440 [Cyanobacteria bacterium P01_A01_bin.45]
MKVKLFSLALIIGAAAFLGACNETTDTPDATTTPATEPADGATPAATPEATKAP